jgi:hypothetical protein
MATSIPWRVIWNERIVTRNCPGPESNRHGGLSLPRDFKSLASTNFATRAFFKGLLNIKARAGIEPAYAALQAAT